MGLSQGQTGPIPSPRSDSCPLSSDPAYAPQVPPLQISPVLGPREARVRLAVDRKPVLALRPFAAECWDAFSPLSLITLSQLPLPGRCFPRDSVWASLSCKALLLLPLSQPSLTVLYCPLYPQANGTALLHPRQNGS